MDKRLVLVGELNPYGSDPTYALYHLPRHASGNRLREHLGLTDNAYLAIPRENLCTGTWSMKAARARAALVLEANDVVVALGARVASAFRGPSFFEAMRFGQTWLLVLPHPSGMNRMWNEPGLREMARSMLRDYAPWVPWGERG